MRALVIVFLMVGCLGVGYGQSWEELNKKGEEAYRNGKYKEALKVLKIAKEQAERQFGVNKLEYATACNNLALIYEIQGVYKKSERLYIKAKKIRERILGKNHSSYATSCNNLAVLYQAQGLYKKSELLFLETKGILAKVLGKNHPNYGSSCGNLGILYQVQGKYKKSESLLKEARKISRKVFGKKHPDYIISCSNLAVLYQVQGKYKKSEPLLKEARNILRKVFGKNHPDYAISCNNLATSYLAQGKYKRSEPLYIEAKNIREKVLGKDHVDYAVSCNNLALLYKTQGIYKKSELLLIEAKNIREKVLGKNHPDYASSCNSLATLYETQGFYKKSEPFYIEAKNIRNKNLGKNHPDYAISCNNLAGLYYIQGLYKKSELLLIEAKNIREKVLGKNHPDYASSCNNLAELHKTQGLYKKSELLLIEAKNIQEKVLGKNHLDYARSCNNLAGLYEVKGRYKKAERLYIEAKNIREKIMGKNHPDYASSCNNLARLYKAQGKFKKSKPLYLRAKNIREKILGKNHFLYTASCNNLAWLCKAQGNYKESESLLYEVFNSLQQQIRKNLALSSEADRQRFLQANISRGFESYNSFAIVYVGSFSVPKSAKVTYQMYNNRLFIKSLLFNSTQKTKERIYASGDTSLIRQYEQFIAKRMYYNKMLDLPKKQRKKRGVNLSKLNNQIEGLEKTLARKSTEFAAALEEYVPHTWQEIQQTLKPGEAAIELIRFRWYNKQWTDTVYYAALIVTPESKYPEPIFLTNGNALEGKLFSYYQKNIGGKSQDAQSYQEFWQPIQQRLQKVYPQATKLFVSLDGVYHKINLETLWNNKTRQYLGETLDIQLVSNTKDLLECTTNPGQLSGQAQRAYLFGYPDYKQFNPQPLSAGNTQAPERYGSSLSSREKRSLAGGFDGKKIPTLSKTKEEVQAIQKILANTMPSTAYLGKTATEENLKAVRNPAILHLATHGFFWDTNDLDRLKKSNQTRLGGTELKQYYENPLMRTGLVWTGAQATFQELPKPKGVQEDGVFTAQEVLNMTLDSTDLVVLSACETGRGKIQNGEGVYGLQRAFLSAGAKHVLMSLWQVDDEATQWFMRYFYQDLVKHQNIHQAYRTAQQRLRKNYPAPYYWGAFVLVSR